MTGQRSGTIMLMLVVVLYALLFGGWFIATSSGDAPPAQPSATSVPPTSTAIPAGWQGLIPTAVPGPTPGLLRPPFTLAPDPTITP